MSTHELAALRREVDALKTRMAMIEQRRVTRGKRLGSAITWMDGRLLHAARIAAGWTTAELSRGIGITGGALHAWERLNAAISHDRAREVVAIFEAQGAEAPVMMEHPVLLAGLRVTS